MKRLADEELENMVHMSKMTSPDSPMAKVCVELQERRAADSEKPNLGWNRDIEALKKRLDTGAAIVVFKEDDNSKYQYAAKILCNDHLRNQFIGEPIAWLPWEG